MTLRLISSLFFIAIFTLFMPLKAQDRPSQSIIRYDSINHPVMSNGGMVASQNYIATDVGAAILAKGGNAVDAAVATGFALAVSVPRAGNIGGGGFMLVRMADSDTTVALDYRSIAPLASSLEIYKGENGRVDRGKSRFGYLAPAVPGTVAGLYEAHKRFGKIKWSEVVAPAIALAENGIKVSLIGGTHNAHREGLIALVVDGVPAVDVVSALNQAGIRTHARKNDHFSGNILTPLGLDSCVRVSFCHYNTRTEIKHFLEVMQQIAEQD